MTMTPTPPTPPAGRPPRRPRASGRPGRPATGRVLGAGCTAAAALVVLAGCTGSSGSTGSTGSPGSPAPGSTTVITSTAAPTSIAPVSEAPVSPSAAVQEIAAPDNACPYITNDAARQAEGDRVGRVTLTTTDPVGCNFYWQYGTQPMILSISVVTYPSQTGAYNAMVRDTVASTERLGVKGLIPQDGCTDATPESDRPQACVDAVLFRTAFYPPDGNTDWACSFAKNSRVITVNTRQNDVSFNAKNVATQIAAQF